MTPLLRPVGDWFARATVRTKVVAAVLVISTLGLLVTGLLTNAIQRGNLYDDIDRELAQEVEEFRRLAERGLDPETGEAFAGWNSFCGPPCSTTCRPPTSSSSPCTPARPPATCRRLPRPSSTTPPSTRSSAPSLPGRSTWSPRSSTPGSAASTPSSSRSTAPTPVPASTSWHARRPGSRRAHRLHAHLRPRGARGARPHRAGRVVGHRLPAAPARRARRDGARRR